MSTVVPTQEEELFLPEAVVAVTQPSNWNLSREDGPYGELHQLIEGITRGHLELKTCWDTRGRPTHQVVVPSDSSPPPLDQELGYSLDRVWE